MNVLGTPASLPSPWMEWNSSAVRMRYIVANDEIRMTKFESMLKRSKA
jgi:hypothetical protein